MFSVRLFNALPLLLLLLLLLFCFSFSCTALARPEMTGQTTEERFAAMDTDKDGKVSREEFFAAQPQMKEGAFVAIDTDTDGLITLEEWKTFISGHAMGNEQRPGMDKPKHEGAAASSRGAMRPAAAHNSMSKKNQ